jgi:hypothetical protein
MLTRRFALVLGIVFVVVGILGFVPGVNSMHHDGAADNLTVHGPGDGYLLGLFHVNVLHNAVHLLFGALGILAAGRFETARTYARFVAIAYGLLAIMGLVPAANMWNTFGLIPIHGNNVWLHALVAAAAAYFGFILHAPSTTATGDDLHTAPRV